MEKAWFVHVNKHHKGPYTDEEIQFLINTGHINDNTFLWKRGLTDWIRLGKTAEFGSAFGPQKINTHGLEDQERPTVKQSDGKLLRRVGRLDQRKLERPTPEQSLRNRMAPLTPGPGTETLFNTEQLQAIQADLSGPELTSNETSSAPPPPAATPTAVPQVKLPDTPAVANKQQARPRKRGRALVFVTFILFIFVIATVGYRIYKDRPFWLQPKELTSEDYQRLMQVHKATKAKYWKIEVAMAKKGQSIWLAANRKDSRQVMVELTSISNKVLATNPIAAKSTAILKSGLAVFDRFEFTSGSTLYPGYYKLALYDGGKVGPSGKSLSKRPVGPSKLLEQTVFLSNASKRRFGKSLAGFHAKVKLDKLKYVGDLIQKNATYVSVIEKIENDLLVPLGKISSKRAAQQLQQQYLKSSGALLTRLIQDDDKIYIRLYEQYPELAKLYQATSKRGKQMSSFISDLFAQLRPTRSTGRSQIRRFKEHFSELKEAFLLAGFNLKKMHKKLKKGQ